jgi:hypothetical protein
VWSYTRTRRGPYDIFFLLIFGQSLALRFWKLLQRETLSFPGRTQIRLNERGCVQYDTLPAPSWPEDLYKLFGWLNYFLGALVVLYMCLDHALPNSVGWILGPILLVFGLAYGLEARRFRKRLARVPDGAIADRNAAYFLPTPWRKVRHFGLKLIKDQRHHLQIGTGDDDLEKASAVDAEILCRPEQAEEIIRWVNERLATARAAMPAAR